MSHLSVITDRDCVTARDTAESEKESALEVKESKKITRWFLKQNLVGFHWIHKAKEPSISHNRQNVFEEVSGLSVKLVKYCPLGIQRSEPLHEILKQRLLNNVLVCQ